jgi:AraC-like DNA-binding protein
MPKVGSYTTGISNQPIRKFTNESGGIVLPAENIHYKAISDVIDDLIIIINMDDLKPILDKKYNIVSFKNSFIKLDANSEKVASVRSFIESTLQSARNFPHLRESLLLKTNIKEITILFVADLIADSLKIAPISISNPGSLIVRKAEAYIEHECENIFTIQEIANKLNTTPRTLQIAFKKHREYTPMQFLKERKLYKARKLLLNQKDSNFSIKQAALSAGLLDLNRFSRYYNELFGELPSTTIKKDTIG